MRDWPVAETCTFGHIALKETDILPTGMIQTRNPSKRVAADPRTRLHGSENFLSTQKY